MNCTDFFCEIGQGILHASHLDDVVAPAAPNIQSLTDPTILDFTILPSAGLDLERDAIRCTMCGDVVEPNSVTPDPECKCGNVAYRRGKWSVLFTRQISDLREVATAPA